MSRFSPSSGGGSSVGSSLGNSIVAMGDSITIGAGSATISGWNSDNSWFSHACFQSSGKLRLVYNGGISGQRSDQIITRISTDVIAKNPKMCAILAGTNDVNGSTLATYLSSMEGMVKQLIGVGITPILCTIPPMGTTTALRSKTTQLNIIIRQLAQKYKLNLVDFYSLLVDPATGNFITGYSADNIHPNAATSKLMGQTFANQISPLLPNGDGFLPVFNNDTANGILGGLFLTDTNADGIGDNWTTSGTGAATFSLITDANIKGRWQEVSKTVNDTNAITIQSNVIATSGAGFSPGDKIIVCARIRTEGIESGAATFSFRLKWNGTSGGPYPMKDWSREFDGLVYQEITIPNPNTTLQIQITINQGIGKVRIAQAGIYNLTALGVV